MLLAYHNKKSVKIETVSAMEADIKAERLISGDYWNERRQSGCFVGCVIRGNEHSKFELQIGVPRILARLGDRIFEGLGNKEARQKFAVDFLNAIPVGADLSSVWPKFAVFMLADKDFGVIKFIKDENKKKLAKEVAGLYRRMINGEKISESVWKELSNRMPYSSWYAAAAADAYAADAAAAAAYAADAAAADAYAAYAAAYAAAAARSRHFAALATALLKFLSAAKRPNKEAA